MNEQELRGLVREAIERQIGHRQSTIGGRPAVGSRQSAIGGLSSDHASHILLNVIPGSEIDDGMCVIEPAVRCNHCGFCQSYGH